VSERGDVKMRAIADEEKMQSDCGDVKMRAAYEKETSQNINI